MGHLFRANTTTKAKGSTSTAQCLCVGGYYLNSNNVCQQTGCTQYSAVENEVPYAWFAPPMVSLLEKFMFSVAIFSLFNLCIYCL